MTKTNQLYFEIFIISSSSHILDFCGSEEPTDDEARCALPVTQIMGGQQQVAVRTHILSQFPVKSKSTFQREHFNLLQMFHENHYQCEEKMLQEAIVQRFNFYF